MCITIPSSPRADRKSTPSSRLWRWLIYTPSRLFWAGGLLSLLPFISILLHWPVDPWNGFNLLFGIAPFFLFGLLLEVYPAWLRGTPVRYARYGLVFFLLCAAQLTYFLFAGMSVGADLVYLLFLLAAWGLGITTLKGIGMLASDKRLAQVRWINYALLLGLAALVYAAVGLFFDWQQARVCGLWLGITGYLMPVVLLTLLNHFDHAKSSLPSRR